jgi:hypothetical protein
MPPTLRRALQFAALIGVILVTAAVLWALGPGASWVLRHVDGVHGLKGKELEDALDAVRGRALAVGTGLAALVAVYYTARNADTARKALQQSTDSARRTAELTEQGQVTERYTKAIEQLGNRDSLDVRIGGIYALERIATDSVRDHPTVMEVLTAFIREHAATYHSSAPLTATADKATPPSSPPGTASPRRPAADVRAALTVISRRVIMQDGPPIDLSGADLSGAELRYARLRGAHLRNAKLVGADLSYADLNRAATSIYPEPTNLVGADLRDAKLTQAGLTHANLAMANLTGAYLSGADLTGANLTDANLTDADLAGANLNMANLTGTNLTGANLTNTGLAEVTLSDDTRWPEG